eukprot:2823483-Pyramimonas_sp.AAC.1
MAGLQEILSGAPVDPNWVQFRKEIKDTDGLPMESSKTRSLLVVMMLMLREPRVFLWPFPHAEQAGDVIEAILGFCVPWQEAHR